MCTAAVPRSYRLYSDAVAPAGLAGPGEDAPARARRSLETADTFPGARSSSANQPLQGSHLGLHWAAQGCAGPGTRPLP